jgi:hypothetical protein
MQISIFSIVITVSVVVSGRLIGHFRSASGASIDESQLPPEIVPLKQAKSVNVTSPRSVRASRLAVNGYDDRIRLESAVAFLAVNADLVFDGQPMTIEFSSDDNDDDDDIIRTTVVFDAWHVYKSPPSVWLDRRPQISVTFVCRKLRKFKPSFGIFGMLRSPRLSDDGLSLSSRYRDWCEADSDVARADAFYVVFAVRKDAVFWSTGSPEPATEKIRRLAHYYSQPHRGR